MKRLLTVISVIVLLIMLAACSDDIPVDKESTPSDNFEILDKVKGPRLDWRYMYWVRFKPTGECFLYSDDRHTTMAVSVSCPE